MNKIEILHSFKHLSIGCVDSKGEVVEKPYQVSITFTINEIGNLINYLNATKKQSEEGEVTLFIPGDSGDGCRIIQGRIYEEPDMGHL